MVRYADTAGDNADYPVPEARLYRDYVLDAFQHDKPFDQFIREQLAGDILAASPGRRNPTSRTDHRHRLPGTLPTPDHRSV